ncbi:ribosomal protein S5 domain 2-type protein [Amylocarpus encephaloides]|uniref:Ribosomal protein S5 domain 2-type protein n=1 Tax=Amylocarpus encephaloides TaxID=45428 RepID=A0A9P7YJ16_9HELO|nr:ribosomal protein S5 domain 2-type protein [Amylocarpus encephaloides]
MTEDLINEIEVINSIYGDHSLTVDGNDAVYILHLPQHALSLRLRFPADYPHAPPVTLGTQSSGERRGEAAHVVEAFRAAVGRLFRPGEVCLFDAIEDVNSTGVGTKAIDDEGGGENTSTPQDLQRTGLAENLLQDEAACSIPPSWTLSDVVVELKSVFIARSAKVSSPDQASRFLRHLLDTDKKVRSATHNITAWRIQGENAVTYQDCDDDGETAAGGRVLHLMQLMDLWGVMVVVTRWYGGHQLGPKRFSIINRVARDAFVKGGFVKEGGSTKKKAKH